MPNVQTRTRFTSDSEFIAEYRNQLLKGDAASVRKGYFELVQSLEELLWTERLLREKVLSHDRFSTTDRLWGAQLAEHTRSRKVCEVPVISTSSVASSQMTGCHIEVEGFQFVGPNLALQDRKFLLRAALNWCHGEAGDEENIPFTELVEACVEGCENCTVFEVDNVLRGIFSALASRQLRFCR